MAPKSARLSSSAGSQPKVAIIDTGPRDGVFCHQSKCSVPIAEPAMKAARVTTMRVLPPPAV